MLPETELHESWNEYSAIGPTRAATLTQRWETPADYLDETVTEYVDTYMDEANPDRENIDGHLAVDLTKLKTVDGIGVETADTLIEQIITQITDGLPHQS